MQRTRKTEVRTPLTTNTTSCPLTMIQGGVGEERGEKLKMMPKLSPLGEAFPCKSVEKPEPRPSDSPT